MDGRNLVRRRGGKAAEGLILKWKHPCVVDLEERGGLAKTNPPVE